ncbi:site-2 protease family protein [Methanobrevibacter filiformis]|uniref:Peptidase family M50 n=1 Tax=Methanobrevibacter filiformis TaxID=55758 RepID=A0A162FEA4_9EURY|nr:site-2 protease family protein [Methanobrevibacter filiformis]KZX11765.1 peptidase family M50 [Methanobrevibacter filiformis]
MFKVTSREIRDLIISFIVISVAFSILYARNSGEINAEFLPTILPMVMVGVGLGFILHELAHKFTAIHYGYWAEFRMWFPGLVIALISPMFGFIFAAPGAVYINGEYMSDKENGIISLSGPVTNIILALLFFVGSSTLAGMAISGTTFETIQLAYTICNLGFGINAFLALFNLVPFSVLDGAKIIRWNPVIWLITIAIAGIMTYISFIGL